VAHACANAFSSPCGVASIGESSHDLVGFVLAIPAFNEPVQDNSVPHGINLDIRRKLAIAYGQVIGAREKARRRWLSAASRGHGTSWRIWADAGKNGLLPSMKVSGSARPTPVTGGTVKHHIPL